MKPPTIAHQLCYDVGKLCLAAGIKGPCKLVVTSEPNDDRVLVSFSMMGDTCGVMQMVDPKDD